MSELCLGSALVQDAPGVILVTSLRGCEKFVLWALQP
jgi:hypothetical protein